MRAPPRQLQITYGSTVASGTLSSATLTLHNVHSITKTAEDFSVSYSVLVSATTEAIFAAGVASFEAAMTTRRQDFKVETLSTAGAVDQTLLSLSHTANTALNITPELSKPGGPADTNLSRIYEVTVSGGLPEKAALAGLRSFEYDVEFSPSRRGSLTVRGTYTAVASTQAAAQYAASIAARVSSITTALSGTWELVDERYTPDGTDQLVTFNRTYRELIFDEDTGTRNVASIVDQTLAIKTDRVGSEGKREERKLSTITATYSCGVDKGETTDLETLWTGTIRPWIVSNIQDVAGDRLAIVSQSVDYDLPENRINATMTANARNGGDTLAKTVTEVTEVDMGIIFARTWPTSKPKATAATDSYVYQGPKTITKTITTATTRLGVGESTSITTGSGGGGSGGILGNMGFGEISGGIDADFGMFGIGSTGVGESILDFSSGNIQRKGGGGSGGSSASGADTKGGILIKASNTIENRSIGIAGEQLDVYDQTVVEVYEFVNQIKSGSGAGGGGGTRVR